MSVQMNGYVLDAPFSNKDAGFSRWTTAVRDGKRYFIKEFLNPVYPILQDMSEDIRREKINDCSIFELDKRRLYSRINEASDGNIVRINEFFRYDAHYYIVSDYIEAMLVPAAEMVNIPFIDRLLLCRQLAHSGMMLHRNGIAHADIKETNILIRRSATGKLVGKIIDLDCCFSEENPPRYEYELSGDQVYLSPESCRFMFGDPVRLNCKIDVFAFGLLFHQYLTGSLPEFDRTRYNYPHESILDGRPLILSKNLYGDIRTTLARMLIGDPERRISMETAFLELQKFDPKTGKVSPGSGKTTPVTPVQPNTQPNMLRRAGRL